MTLIRLDFCCNDPDNGLFDARAAAITGPDMLFQLSANDMRGPVFRELEEVVAISRRRFPYERCKYGFGNWCWNAYWFDSPVAVDLLAYVRTMKRFGLDEAESRFYERWKAPRSFDARDREFLERQLVKAMLAERRPI